MGWGVKRFSPPSTFKPTANKKKEKNNHPQSCELQKINNPNMINRNISAIINRAATDGMWTEEPTAHDSVTEDNRRCDPAGSCLACLPTRLFHIQLSAGVVVGVLPCHHKQTFCWKQTPVGIVCKTSRMQHGSVHISQEILALSRTSHFSLGSLSPDAVHSNIDYSVLDYYE